MSRDEQYSSRVVAFAVVTILLLALAAMIPLPGFAAEHSSRTPAVSHTL